MTSGEPTAVKRIDKMFRQHDVAPQDVVSPLFRQLTREWAALHAMPTTSSRVRRWARDEPALAGFTRPGDIVDAIDAAEPTRKDELLAALIRRFQAGHQLAGRTVLQSLLPVLASTRPNVALCTSSMDTWVEDRRHITIAEFWAVMASYPIERRPTNVPAGLRLDTLNRVLCLRRQADPTPLDPAEMVTLNRPHPHEPAPTEPTTGELTAEADLVQVIVWGLQTNVITRDDATLLITAYRTTDNNCGFADAAQQLGLTQAAVRQRCSRAARKLTDAVRTELTGDALAPGSAA